MSRSNDGPSVILIIRDGWGESPHREHDAFNAVRLARTPVADRLTRDFPHTLIRTSGEDVGLPDGVAGNSEVGHQNIGAGRVVDQEVMRINRAIRDGTFFKNEALLGAFAHAREHDSNVHLMGLVSDGLVHSDIAHLFALIDLAAKEGFPGDRVFIHAFTDGRDTGPTTGLGFIKQLEAKLKGAGIGRIVSVIGRYYAMDRDHRWARTVAAYTALTGRSIEDADVRTAPTAHEAIQHYYDNPAEPNRDGDEFVNPSMICFGDSPKETVHVSDGDAVIFFNFRGDRPRQITRAFVLDDDEWAKVKGGGFNRGAKIKNLYFCTMAAYEEGLPVSAVVFPKPPMMNNILGEIVSSAGLTQFRSAETEKFAHVTFFFNDYREDPFPGETRLLCPSPRDVSTYDQKPEMSAHDVCAGVLDRLRAEDCEPLIVVNFANPDMVGHTGRLAAAVQAVEVVDGCVGRIVEAALARGGSLVITADHGNAEQMWNPEDDCPHTAHTPYDVPLILVGQRFEDGGATLRPGGRLADIAPTLLQLMKLKAPTDMTGRSLIELK